MKNKDCILELLEQEKVDYTIIDHKPICTIEEMEQLGLENSDSVAKNLFVRDDKKRNYYLIVIDKSKTVNLKELRTVIGSRALSFASDSDLEKYLKLNPGEVTPFGVLNDVNKIVKVIIDKSLENGMIGIHPNTNKSTVWMDTNKLISILSDNGNAIEIIDL